MNGLPSGEELNLEALAPSCSLRRAGIPHLSGFCKVRARNGMGISEPVALNLSSPGERALRVLPGMRVRAVWASWLKLRCHIEAVMFLSYKLSDRTDRTFFI